MLPELGYLREGSLTLRDLRFYKYHGLGNDFILLDNRDGKIPDDRYSLLARKLCNRNFWIGADGLLIIEDTRRPGFDIRYRMFNPDGSEAEMCGNGIRCFAIHLYSEGIINKKEIVVDTLAGKVVPLINTDEHGNIIDVTVDMGPPRFKRGDIPVKGPPEEECMDEKITIGDRTFIINCVSMGNPHCVIFTDKIDMNIVRKYGPQIENHPLFPARINVEFVKPLDKTEAEFAVWERGAGITLACGTGASAAVAVGVKKGIFPEGEYITVYLPGGDLHIKYTDGRIFMRGPAARPFVGEISEILI